MMIRGVFLFLALTGCASSRAINDIGDIEGTSSNSFHPAGTRLSTEIALNVACQTLPALRVGFQSSLSYVMDNADPWDIDNLLSFEKQLSEIGCIAFAGTETFVATDRRRRNPRTGKPYALVVEDSASSLWWVLEFLMVPAH